MQNNFNNANFFPKTQQFNVQLQQQQQQPFGEFCQTHRKQKLCFVVNQQNQHQYICEDCRRSPQYQNCTSYELNQINEFKNSLETYVKGIKNDQNMLQFQFTNLGPILIIENLQKEIYKIDNNIQNFISLNEKLQRSTNNNSMVCQILSESQISSDVIINKNFSFLDANKNLEKLSTAMQILKKALDQIKELIPMQTAIQIQPMNQKIPPQPMGGQKQFQIQNQQFPQFDANRLTKTQIILQEKDISKQVGQDFKYDQMKINQVSMNLKEDLLVIGADLFKVDDQEYYIQIWNINPGLLKISKNLKGHTRAVKTVKFIENGIFLSGSIDKTIIIWSLSANNEWMMQQQLSGHSLSVNCLEYNFINKNILSGSQELILWKADYQQNNQYSQKIKKNYSVDEIIQSITYLKDFQYFLAASKNYITLYEFQFMQTEIQQMKQMKADNSILYLMRLNKFDFYVFHENEIVLYEQNQKDQAHYDRKKIDDDKLENSITNFQFADKPLNNLTLMSICYSNKQCVLYQILNNDKDNNRYSKQKVAEYNGQICYISSNEIKTDGTLGPKICIISDNAITVYVVAKN